MEMFADGQSLGTDSDWKIPTTYLVPGNTRVLSVVGRKTSGKFFGIIGSTSHGLVTDGTWKCSSDLHVGWNSPDFDDQDWPLAKVVGINGDKPWYTIDGISETAKWIWAKEDKDYVYCRLKLK
ncbi:unnamed protein product [Porites lobata]|uniref:Lectin n=1 Tax=Porites lobata TaxID=104759 RepID=A0ABN8PQC3_9CNID|nr:unnamed protein product [Porites lobata]